MRVAKMTGAGEVPVWGSRSVRRESVHNDDMAGPCVFLMNLPDGACGQSYIPGYLSL
jgi:hypothetical protein